MPLASHGTLRASARNVSNALAHQNAPGHNARSIHIPTSVRPFVQAIAPSVPSRNATHKLFSQSRNLLSKVFAQLTAPGLRLPTYAHAHGASASLHTASRATIQQGLSLPVRTALSRGARQNLFMPRAPAPVGRVTQVGLGTARNFSSTRPLFQNLVENVPIVGRTLYDAADDWELKMHKEQNHMRRLAKGKNAESKKSKEMIKAKANQIPIFQESKEIESDEIDHYFPATAPAVTTYLLIPLAPTPTSRVPLSSSADQRLLPLPHLASIHASHSTHSLRVSTLFTRLDQANVWARGVKCSAYGQGPKRGNETQEEVCTVLQVAFEGWTKAEVRSVIGESGTGWCVLEEVREEEEEDDCLSDISVSSSVFGDTDMEMPAFIDPAQSFKLPTLDFSSSFTSSISPTQSPLQDTYRAPSLEFDFDDDDSWINSSVSSLSSSRASSPVPSHLGMSSWVEPPSTNGWFLSSRFADRSIEQLSELEPREGLFY